MSSLYRQSYTAHDVHHGRPRSPGPFGNDAPFAQSSSQPGFRGYDSQGTRYSENPNQSSSGTGTPANGATFQSITSRMGPYVPVDPFGRLIPQAPREFQTAQQGGSSNAPANPMSPPPPEQSVPTPFSTAARFTPSPTAVGSSIHAFGHPRTGESQNLNQPLDESTIPFPTTTPTNFSSWSKRLRTVRIFILDVVPKYLYLGILLHIPVFYYGRIIKVFTDAGLSLSDIDEIYWLANEEILDEELSSRFGDLQDRYQTNLNLIRFKALWEDLMRTMTFEWQVQCILAVLLLSAIFTILQIDEFRQDPLSRTSALLSLMAALASLLHGCLFVVRFGTTSTLRQAATWAWEAQLTKTRVIWNTWILVALPVIWLSWALIAFVVALLSYVWRTGAGEMHEPLTRPHAIGVRVVITVIFTLGLTCLALTLKTLAGYGSGADNQWRNVDERKHSIPPSPSHTRPPSVKPASLSRVSSLYSMKQGYPVFEPAPTPGLSQPAAPSLAVPHPIPLATSTSEPRNSVLGPYEALLALQYSTLSASEITPASPLLLSSKPLLDDPTIPIARQSSKQSIFRFSLPDSPTIVLTEKGIQASEWDLFTSDLERAWEGTLPIPNVTPDKLLSLRATIIHDILRTWNSRYFASRGLEVVISELNEALNSASIVVYNAKILPPDRPTASSEAAVRVAFPQQPEPIRTKRVSESSYRSSWPSSRLVSQRQSRTQRRVRTPRTPSSGQRHSAPSTLSAAQFQNTAIR